MNECVQRELWLEASAEEVWDAVTAEGWLAVEVQLELWPGGEAWFRTRDGVRSGWVEEARAPSPGGAGGHLAFWWATEGEPASRVEITIEERGERTRLRVAEARPLELLDLVGLPLSRIDGRSFGPALAA